MLTPGNLKPCLHCQHVLVYTDLGYAIIWVVKVKLIICQNSIPDQSFRLSVSRLDVNLEWLRIPAIRGIELRPSAFAQDMPVLCSHYDSGGHLV